MPLLSDAATGREKGFVFEEWRTANECTSDLAREFVVPLIVDADYQPNRYTTRQVPNWPVSKWSGLDFGHAPDGVPDARTLTRLKTLLRQARPPAA